MQRARLRRESPAASLSGTGCPSLGVPVKPSGTIRAKELGDMRRLVIPLTLVIVLAIGVSLGLAGRTWMDGGQSQQPDASTAAAPASTLPPAASTVQATVLPRGTLAPTVTAAPRDVVMEVSESDLQEQLSTMLVGQSLGATPLGDATIQSVTVALRDSQVKVGGAAKAGFLQAPFTAAGTVVPNAAGRPMVSISEATVGGVMLPDGAKTALAESLQTQVDGLFADRSMRVRAIDIIDGKMRVVGTASGS
jgi:hypothetical protein